MKELILSNDPFQMNWVEGTHEWGTVKCNVPLAVTVTSQRSGDIVRESYTFTNQTDKDVFTSIDDIKIYTPFNDDYIDAEACLTQRCHTHIWCGGEVSYIMALRMGGAAPHLGLVLTQGSLEGYSVDRDILQRSNDRGDFMLHPAPAALVPGASFTLEWVLFPFSDKPDFFVQAAKYCGRLIEISAKNYILFQGETLHISIVPHFSFRRQDVSILENGILVNAETAGGKLIIEKKAETVGEYCYDICINQIHTKCRVLVQPSLWELAKARCRFIVEKQQYHNPQSGLDGAYLEYDNEEEHLRYAPENDHNAARERVGMGILLAKYLQLETVGNETLDASLKKYVAFVRRELLMETGEICNDYMRNNSYKRLYNAPWFALFFTEVYSLYHHIEDVRAAYQILKFFYQSGGGKFYAIGLPALAIAKALKDAGMPDEHEEMIELFKAHSDCLAEMGVCYPKSEVNYEQSIVAPAADILAQTYLLTRDKKYAEALKIQISVLDLFNGCQPDYHLNETAIRHWDGFWFGKRRMYGDTFPHYWSALTGIVYRYYAQISGDSSYAEKSEKSLRGVLSMFYPDGKASCAYVYPVSVNGQKAAFADPYANDQDWGLYFALRNLT